MSDINPGYVFKAGEADTVTSGKLNQLLGEATLNPLPRERVERLMGMLNQKADTEALGKSLAERADRAHSHAIEDVVGLCQALSAPHSHALEEVAGLKQACEGLAEGRHSHAVDAIEGLAGHLGVLAQTGKALVKDAEAVAHDIKAHAADCSTQAQQKADQAHGHSFREVALLEDTLSHKAPLWHTHAVEDITGFHADLECKARNGHTHGMDAVNGLQAALDRKAPSGHRHHWGTLSGFGTASGRYVTGTLEGASGGHIPTAALVEALIDAVWVGEFKGKRFL